MLGWIRCAFLKCWFDRPGGVCVAFKIRKICRLFFWCVCVYNYADEILYCWWETWGWPSRSSTLPSLDSELEHKVLKSMHKSKYFPWFSVDSHKACSHMLRLLLDIAVLCFSVPKSRTCEAFTHVCAIRSHVQNPSLTCAWWAVVFEMPHWKADSNCVDRSTI